MQLNEYVDILWNLPMKAKALLFIAAIVLLQFFKICNYLRVPLANKIKDRDGKIYCPKCKRQVHYNKHSQINVLICDECGAFVGRRSLAEMWTLGRKV
ncbi:hypothetical protein [Maridesulfovibrio hydrothermalis]|uniref:Uncharacterized protein n=1 Tax=Maridesulfovibrio hydrothermalis AM13 = DSM 14728 TaxID=1121451 RepID=L0R6D5_9BACT|nr:hypothetical protein [Maridesulfovibrio hydrothermalis]CCO22264.1 protein of unknown function [Maridesulfovibrio hydrothermalis AM13 = DSM 14728]